MSYIDDIFKRSSIQHLRSFILDGTINNVDDCRSYDERIDGATKKLISCIRDRIKGEEAEKIINLVHLYGSTHEDVFLEIGMQIGALLAAETLHNLNKAFATQDFEAWNEKISSVGKEVDSNKKE